MSNQQHGKSRNMVGAQQVLTRYEQAQDQAQADAAVCREPWPTTAKESLASWVRALAVRIGVFDDLLRAQIAERERADRLLDDLAGDVCRLKDVAHRFELVAADVNGDPRHESGPFLVCREHSLKATGRCLCGEYLCADCTVEVKTIDHRGMLVRRLICPSCANTIQRNGEGVQHVG